MVSSQDKKVWGEAHNIENKKITSSRFDNHLYELNYFEMDINEQILYALKHIKHAPDYNLWVLVDKKTLDQMRPQGSKSMKRFSRMGHKNGR